MILSQSELNILMWFALLAASPAAQIENAASACPSPEVVLQRYVDAIGGKAVYDIRSRAMTARESEGNGGTEHWVYKFKWKAPNKVAASSNPYLLNIIPVSHPLTVLSYLAGRRGATMTAEHRETRTAIPRGNAD